MTITDHRRPARARATSGRRRRCRRRRSTTATRHRSSSARSSAPTSTATSPASGSTRRPRTPARTPARCGAAPARCSRPSPSPARRRRAGSRRRFPNPVADHRQHDLRRSRITRRSGTTPAPTPTSHTAVDNPPLHALAERCRRRQRPVRVQHGDDVPDQHLQLRELLGRRRLHDDAAARHDAADDHARGSRPSAQTNVDPATPVTATFSEAMDPATISSSTGSAEGGAPAAGTFELRDPSNNLRDRDGHLRPVDQDRDAWFRRAASRCRRPIPRSSRAARTDPRVKDVAGNAMAANRDLDVHDRGRTAAAGRLPVLDLDAGASCRSRWTTAIRARSSSEPSSGRTFPGFITGARFYKAALNTGTHVAALWTNTGTLLAIATFSGESASGWQQVSFPTPIAIAANTTYVISYLAPNGHYPGQDGYFATAGVDNAPLHALQERRRRPERRLRVQHDERVPDRDLPVGGVFRRRRVQHDERPGRHRADREIGEPVRRRLRRADDHQRHSSPSWRRWTRRRSSRRTSSCARRRARSCRRRCRYTAATNTATIVPTASLAYSTTYTGVVKAGGEGSRRQRDGRRLHVDVHDLGAAAAAADAGPGRPGPGRDVDGEPVQHLLRGDPAR